MHLQQQRIRSPDEFQLTDVNTVKHDSKHQRPSFRFIHIASEQPIHIVGIRTMSYALVKRPNYSSTQLPNLHYLVIW